MVTEWYNLVNLRNENVAGAQENENGGSSWKKVSGSKMEAVETQHKIKMMGTNIRASTETGWAKIPY